MYANPGNGVMVVWQILKNPRAAQLEAWSMVER